MPKVAIVAALQRELSPLIKHWGRVPHQHEGRDFTFFEHGETVAVCGGIGVEAARRATEAVIAIYGPVVVQSVGFTGALDATLRVGDIFLPALVIDARDGSRCEIPGGQGTLLTFMAVAGAQQKSKAESKSEKAKLRIGIKKVSPHVGYLCTMIPKYIIVTPALQSLVSPLSLPSRILCTCFSEFLPLIPHFAFDNWTKEDNDIVNNGIENSIRACGLLESFDREGSEIHLDFANWFDRYSSELLLRVIQISR